MMGSTYVGIWLLWLSQALLASATWSGKRSSIDRRQLPGNWTYEGCYTDIVGKRTLAGAAYGSADAMTTESCISYCNTNGYIYAGTEYSTECFCGVVIATSGTLATEEECKMPCSGNSTQSCGGPDRLSIYVNFGVEPPPPPVHNPGVRGWKLVGCYTDSVDGRTLATGVNTEGGGAQLTVERCLAACDKDGFLYSGMEYGGECYCGNTFSNGGKLAPDGFDGCNVVCNGNKTEYCGGPNRLNVYESDHPSPTATNTASPTATTGPIPTTLPDGWEYKGCYIDNANGRIMLGQQPDRTENTIESCVDECFNLGHSIAGLQYSRQCFCDDWIRNGAGKVADSQCNMACSGNPSQKCGGSDRMTIYSNGTLKEFVPPATQRDGLPGNWEYQGCIYDDAEARTFPYQIILDKNNTAKNCLSQCSEFGYGAGGMEFGRECYCGDPIDVSRSNSRPMPEEDCNVACTGNDSYICGAGNRMSYYKWTGSPLTQWEFTSGNDAGRYEFLIGGVIIPLITQPAVNGKIVFLEKWGTGPPNTTGAYELDLTLLNNFTAAWRPMHVKTDIFCAAGLTLPDKVGRQINVGGWANGATYGVRFYWPDGKPGVWGVNDWQEDVTKVSLQIGRWYPTAMIMANGSILVVGGQVGSNGAPVPSLELLPRTPGGNTVIHCDYLERTDPYNLYPFLAVLPGGGIMISYYNEARILDEVTFDTVKVLPNVPGAVNNFLGGRTYPFEGSMVLLPQHAPYTEPLGMMLCGGSTPGPEIALDNCVTIYPEEEDPKWIIERMPSKRVIPCMAALPDGTFLILNGGQQGRAGFGTANTPNHNAVLYDPSKPVNQRMTVMANTTIDRLYHSEAILVPDGRVLVSGSDPEDDRFEQEYRVEVFLPPYLLSGLERPSFSIENKDWGYGESVEIKVKINNGGPVRVSLLGAESSTHGLSMGQRTIFPAVECTGESCVITAPPNAHVCPPGWFQLFLLDGPTPSVSTWVRIGGDPAELGKWPVADGFDVPGV